MHSTLFRYTCLLCLSALTLGLAPRACADPATLTKIDPATLTVTQYAPDGTVVGKVTELTDGDEGTRWIFRTTQTPAQYLPLRLQLDMGTAHTVGKVRIANYFTGANFIRGFKTVDLFVGDALAPATGGTPDAADVQVTISDAKGPAWTDVALAKPATGRYVTVRVKANWGGNTYAANEIELYADAGKASTTTPGGGNATTGKAPGTPTTTGNPTTGNPTGGTPATGKTTGTPTGTPATGNVTTGNPGAVNPATANPGTPAATAGTRTYTIYDYSEQAEGMQKAVRLVIPAGLTVVRGILVVGSGAGGDSRDYYQETWYREFLFLHDFAYVGLLGTTSHTETYKAIIHALAQFATDAHHPELVNAPFVTTGFSAGGGLAARLLVEAPDRVIAAVPVCARLNFTGVTPTAAHRGTPACIISGELETNFAAVVDPVLADGRPKGALFGWVTVPGGGHSRMGQEVLAMPYLDAAVRLRYPKDADPRKGPVALLPLDPAGGWVADNTTWKSGLTTIAPAKGYPGVVEKSSWLPTQDLAFAYRAYGTYDKPLTITSPKNDFRRPPNAQPVSIDPAYDPGTDMPIIVDATKFPGWTTLAFYDGATKLGEITHGPAQFTAPGLTPGYHVFTVLGTDAKGQQRTSNPVLVVVHK